MTYEFPDPKSCRILSLDIETTGLNVKRCQILEVGAVLFSLESEEVSEFRMILYHENIKGHPKGLDMNPDLIHEIAYSYPDHEGVCYPNELYDYMSDFLGTHGRITVAGKNVAGFDIPFLKKLDKRFNRLFRVRCLDVGTLYWGGDTDVLPDLLQCCKLAGLDVGEIPHNALDDARIVCRLVKKYNQSLYNQNIL